MYDFLRVALRAVQKASGVLRGEFGKPVRVSQKESHHSILSTMDIKSEEVIVNIIRNEFPTHDIISEESGDGRRSSEFAWILDPLDGSSYYVRGLLEYSISLALMREYDVVLGVVCSPGRRELFHAVKDHGAFLNDKQIRTSPVSRLAECLFCFGHRILRTDEHGTAVGRLLRSARSIRAGGSCAQELCNIACGRLDGLVNMQQSVWDYAAGEIILEEAGGTFSDLEGNRPILKGLKYRDFSLLATNGIIHKEALGCFADEETV